jgi:hypothetical protein
MRMRASNDSSIRKAVKRKSSERYLLITLLSFAGSVSLTRLFLQITGYPQLGGGELHIAHVLWGGLILFAAALLPLIFANRWVFTVSAVLAGAGVGLFIDEVGKFITKSNDYFYPSSAPIIYVTFLLTVLVYVTVRGRKKPDARGEFYAILQDMEEVLDHDLSQEEQKDVMQSLDRVINQPVHTNLARLAESIKVYLSHEGIELVEERPNRLTRTRNWLLGQEKRWMTRMRYRVALAGGMAAWGGWAVGHAILTLSTFNTPGRVDTLVRDLVNDRLVRNASGLNWFEARISMEGTIGIVLIIAAGLLIFKRDKLAVGLSSAALLVTLVGVNLLVFYFDQFSTINSALVQFVLLLGVLRFRGKYLV